MRQVQRLPTAARGEYDAIGSIKIRIVGDIIRHPAPVLPADVIVDRAVNDIGITWINKLVVTSQQPGLKLHEHSQREDGLKAAFEKCYANYFHGFIFQPISLWMFS